MTGADTEAQLSSSSRTLEPEDEAALKKNGWIEAVIEVDGHATLEKPMIQRKI